MTAISSARLGILNNANTGANFHTQQRFTQFPASGTRSTFVDASFRSPRILATTWGLVSREKEAKQQFYATYAPLIKTESANRLGFINSRSVRGY
jgi:hypothetical protein